MDTSTMFEIVNEGDLYIAFDMYTEQSLYGEFGVYIKYGDNICSGVIHDMDWWGIEKLRNDLQTMYMTCRGEAQTTSNLFKMDQIIFSLNNRGKLDIEFNVRYSFYYECHMKIQLDQTYLPRFIKFCELFLLRKPVYEKF